MSVYSSVSPDVERAADHVTIVTSMHRVCTDSTHRLLLLHGCVRKLLYLDGHTEILHGLLTSINHEALHL